MKRLVLTALLLAAACGAPAEQTESGEPALPAVTLPIADQAGNRMEALAQNGTRWCTQEADWCIAAAEDAPLQVTRGEDAITLPAAAEGETLAPWPAIIRAADGAPIVGAVATTSQMYSGGGGQASQVRLYRIADGAAHEVARMPESASLSIRACFTEADAQVRAQACSDEYSFVTRISLDDSVATGAPRIILETTAGTFPGRISRNTDNTAAATEHPLTDDDLVWARDETCSYRRVYAQDADGLYAPDQALPPCADYLEP
ncbi:MAG: hypothetical protein JNJ63_11375 [Hyphomonadaceae bacterium]|nr:hypothetical protein [Hyphomonadaceae bacterium]